MYKCSICNFDFKDEPFAQFMIEKLHAVCSLTCFNKFLKKHTYKIAVKAIMEEKYANRRDIEKTKKAIS